MVYHIFIFSVITIVTILYVWSKRKYNYWKDKNVKFLKPSLMVGNYGDFILLKKNLGENVTALCEKLPDEPIIGAFYGTEPVAIVQDPELIRLVTTKDFYYFNGREITEHIEKEVMTKSLFFTYGDKWKVLRQNLTPLFTSSKLKNMFHLIESCTRALEKKLDDEVMKSDILEMKNLMTRFTMDAICSCAFGINAMVLENVADNPFRDIGEAIVDNSRIRGLRHVIRSIWPSIFYSFGQKLFPIEIQHFFKTIVSNVINERNQKPSSRQDFIDLIMSITNEKCIVGDSIKNMKGGNNEKVHFAVDEEFLVTQCILFFAAGFETSSTTSSLALYELAKNSEIQDRVIEEVDAYIKNKNGALDYDCVATMPYLEQCLNETLRLYPVLPALTREVYEDYTFPNGLKLEKGLRVHLPVWYMHRNPKYFPNPEEFRPERFSPENVKDIVPYTYFPFGEGPRICVGMRFAKMQMIAGLITIFKNYRVEMTDKMPEKLEFSATAMSLQCSTGIHLKLIPRDKKSKH